MSTYIKTLTEGNDTIAPRTTAAAVTMADNTTVEAKVAAISAGKQDQLTAGTNITISNNIISATDTTYSDATTSASGLMSSTDKTKLDGIATGATNVTESTISGWGFTKAGLPTVGAAGNALVFDGTNWTQQDGYGYTSGGGGGGSTIWNGDITGKVCLMDQFYLVDTSIASSASAYIGGTVTVHTNEGDQLFLITSVLTEEGITLLMHANDMYFSAVLMEPLTIEETTYPAGLYFMYMGDEGDIFYASKLVYGSAPVVHLINSKYLSSYRTSSAQDVIDSAIQSSIDNLGFSVVNGVLNVTYNT